MPDEKIAKVYVRPDNTVVLTCPHCGYQKEISVALFREHKHRVTVKCTCKNTFTTNIEHRKRVRKRTTLRGTFVNHSQNGREGNIIVRNVSISGCEFTSLDLPHFRVDDELTLEFTLDDEHMSVIRKEAVVKDIRNNSIGCEFSRAGEYAYDGALGFYISS